ncbi:MAG: hypothetical protein WCA77_06660 [Thermoplasmata archaeon]
MEGVPSLLLVVVVTLVVVVPGASLVSVHNDVGGPMVLSPSRHASDRSLPLPDLHPSVNGEQRAIVATSDPNMVPNTGLEMTIVGWSPTPIAANSSFQVAGELIVGQYDAVFGVFQNSGTEPTPFFEIFQNGSATSVKLEYWKFYNILPGTSYTFALTGLGNGTWALTVNGSPFGGNASASQFDFGATTSTDLLGLSFSEVAITEGASPVPAKVMIPLAIGVFRANAWTLPSSAQLSLSPASPPGWGIDGRVQNPSLAPGELLTGIGANLTTNGSGLWSGGPIPVAVSLVLSVTTTEGISSVVVDVTLRSNLTNVSVGAIPVRVSDSLGSVFSPTPAATAPNGSVQVFMLVANVTASALDTVYASVALLGLPGSSNTTLHVTPAVQAFLSVQPDQVDVSFAHVVPIGILALTSAGTPEAFVSIIVTIEGPAMAVQADVVTGTTGQANITLEVEGQPGTVLLIATVAEGGAWGHASWTLGTYTRVNAVITYGLDLAILVVAIVATVVAVLVYLSRRGRRPMPQLPMQDPEPGPTEPINRTPP